MLTEKVFPRQAGVTTIDDWTKSLASRAGTTPAFDGQGRAAGTPIR